MTSAEDGAGPVRPRRSLPLTPTQQALLASASARAAAVLDRTMAEVRAVFEKAPMRDGQDVIAEAWRTLARFEARSVDLDRLPDLPEVREEADVAAWQAAGHLRGVLDEVERLRGLLARLEWADPDMGSVFCPACGGGPTPGHDPGCWLAAEIATTPHA